MAQASGAPHRRSRLACLQFIGFEEWRDAATQFQQCLETHSGYAEQALRARRAKRCARLKRKAFGCRTNRCVTNRCQANSETWQVNCRR